VTARSLRVEADGVTVAVRALGADADRPPVVLVPGTGEVAGTWERVAEGLAGSRRVLAVELPGHGGSDWPGTYSLLRMAQALAAALPQLADGPVDLVGHSLGGWVALRVAAAHPELVHRLVLEDVGMPHARIPVPRRRPAGDLPFDWRVVEQVLPEVDAPADDWPDVIAAVAAPVLVVAGGPRSFVALDHVDELVAALAEARSVVLGTGHEVHAEKPAEFTDAVRAFLGG
jgi:pimeloyl-ACP methyl ester carboxylesterase